MYRHILKKYFILFLTFTLLLCTLNGCGKKTVYDDVATNNLYAITTENNTPKKDNITGVTADGSNTSEETTSVENSINHPKADSDIAEDQTESGDVDDCPAKTDAVSTEIITESTENNNSFADTTNDSEKGTTESTVEATDTLNYGNAIPEENIKIGVIYTTTPAEFVGYTYIHDLGIQRMQQNIGLSDEQIIRKIYVDDSNTLATEAAIQKCIDDGCNVIFATSDGYAETVTAMAAMYPNVYFASCNAPSSTQKNLASYSACIYQAQYLAGISAGKKTQTGKIGCISIGDINNSTITAEINAFAMGVSSINPDARVYVRITNSILSSDREEQCAKDLAFIGCDVLAQFCYTNEPQCVADINGYWGTGYGTDMGEITSTVTLCSTLWNWDVYYTTAVQNIINGTWTNEAYYGDMANGLVSITEPATHLNDENTISLIEETKSQLSKGTFTIFEGSIETNTGETVGTAGISFDNNTILYDTHWYYKNISVLHSDGSISTGTVK